MKPLSVEDGIVCEFCGTHCYKGAEHNARVEDNARFDDPKPAGVEDGRSDEQAVLAKTFRECVVCGHTWYPNQEGEACPHCIRYPPRSAAPEELTAQPAVPVEERTEYCIACGTLASSHPRENCKEAITEIKPKRVVFTEAVRNNLATLENETNVRWAEPQPISEERTAEMEQLMASFRAAAEHGMKSDFRDCYPLALATAPNILKLLDHIEGKAEEVQE